MAMQALVIAHAAYGHNSFFKGNYLFRMWTDASSIIDYLVYAKNYVADCEERHGMQEVENLLDSCHALMNHGVDRYRRPSRKSLAQELAARKEREAHAQQQVNDLWRTLPKKVEGAGAAAQAKRFPEDPQENLLYFMEKHAPLLEPWQREVVRIVRKVAQYFYPQRQTQVMNEGRCHPGRHQCQAGPVLVDKHARHDGLARPCHQSRHRRLGRVVDGRHWAPADRCRTHRALA